MAPLRPVLPAVTNSRSPSCTRTSPVAAGNTAGMSRPMSSRRVRMEATGWRRTRHYDPACGWNDEGPACGAFVGCIEPFDGSALHRTEELVVGLGVLHLV